MQRIMIFVYGIICYLIGAGAYFIGFNGFMANLLGPYSVDRGAEAPLGIAVAINVGLIVLFGLPHSLMARQGFKRWWTRIVPPAAERSTFMLQAGLLAILLIWQWRAIPITIWRVEDPLARGVIWAVYVIGWVIAFIATFLINHFELAGLQQVYAHLRGQTPPSPSFRTPLFYRVVRHPMQLGVMMALWAAPHMTVGRLVFALGMSVYILIGLHFEERDLVRDFGDDYRAYQRTVPKLIPLSRARNTQVKAAPYTKQT